MTSGDEDSQRRSPFTRPGFIAGGLVVALIVVLGVVIGIVNMTNNDPDTDPTASTSSDPDTDPTSEEPTDVDVEASICGLEGSVTEAAQLTAAPDVDEWAYQSTTAYPVSGEFGPAEDDADGVRYCFQRSPEGALFMSANALVQGSDPSVSDEWVQYVLADGPYRDELVGQVASAAGAGSSRMSIVGFRLLHYDGETARVDLAARASSQGQTVTVSGVYELIWQDGDWKISADVAEPLNVATIPDLAGYIPWEE